ncbi:MAG TPA: hypothetical protein VFR14_11860 [Candidatus Limnocylindrales bacterium]|nr:hypothetical protein [Candidatus Limnocylindrales bacterium]
MTDRPAIQVERRAWRIRLGTALLIATILLEGATLVLIGLTPEDRVAAIALVGFRDGLLFFVNWLAFAVVGWLIIRHQPDNVIGWLCAATGFGVSVIAFATGLATQALAADPASREGQLAGWFAHTATLGLIASPVFVFLRFPSGRPLTRSLARFEVAAIVLVASLIPLVAVAPMPLLGFPTTPNPMALSGVPIEPFVWYVTAVMSVILLVAAGSLVVRYRRGSWVERRQIIVLGAAAVVVVADLMMIPITSPAMATTGTLSAPTQVVTAVALTSIPVAIGIAIMRYRLFDIDRIINRTLVYGAVSAVLAAVYVAAVLLLQAPLGGVASREAQTLATAASTLLVAALFRPVRSRAQRAIDRRFDRERYEAGGTIERFSADVRGEVELDAILRDFLDATGRTVHPTTAACWIRGRVG